jgi:hypothetical protein
VRQEAPDALPRRVDLGGGRLAENGVVHVEERPVHPRIDNVDLGAIMDWCCVGEDVCVLAGDPMTEIQESNRTIPIRDLQERIPPVCQKGNSEMEAVGCDGMERRRTTALSAVSSRYVLLLDFAGSWNR